ncbi:MAG: PAC2 family protein [Acidimicrobiia bacterium]|nr:PAC2 family protein [Acidimicrobiia bacterium]
MLHASCDLVDQPSASLWAAVPTYVSGAPSPKATLALVERSVTLLGLDLSTIDLQIATAAYERQIDELVAADEDTAAYVAGLEEAADDEPDDDEDQLDALAASDPSELVEEVERFLRGD